MARTGRKCARTDLARYPRAGRMPRRFEERPIR
jgi:hypothetical protein